MADFIADEHGNVEDIRGKKDYGPPQGSSSSYLSANPKAYVSRPKASWLRGSVAIILFILVVSAVGIITDLHQGRNPFDWGPLPTPLDQWEQEHQEDILLEREKQLSNQDPEEEERKMLGLPPKRNGNEQQSSKEQREREILKLRSGLGKGK